jgi:hypothetical protein
MKQKSIRLQLINFLSDPEIILLDWNLETETEIIPPEVSGNWDVPLRRYTGRKYLKLAFYRRPNNDSTATKAKVRTSKRTTKPD